MRMSQSWFALSSALARRAALLICTTALATATTGAAVPALAGTGTHQAAAAPVAASRVTSPKEQFGFAIGDDYQLATYEQLTAYWRRWTSNRTG